MTGIGHERDETVLDYVAHTRVKTPTAAAAFLIEHQAQEAALLDDLYRRIVRVARERLLRENQRLEKQATLLPLLTHRRASPAGPHRAKTEDCRPHRTPTTGIYHHHLPRKGSDRRQQHTAR